MPLYTARNKVLEIISIGQYSAHNVYNTWKTSHD